MIKVSIIILSWNTRDLLRQCLESVIRDTRYVIRDTEIIVVDNGSTDGSPEMIKEKFPIVKLIRNKTNLGFTKGNNQALRQAQGEVIMFLNSDTVVQSGAIEKLALQLIKESKIAAVSPLVLNEDGSVQKDPCYLRLPSPVTSFFYYNKYLRKLALETFPSLLLSATNFGKPVEVDQLPGAAMMIRKKILEKIGGFDERFPIYFEDTDLSFRIKKNRYKLMVIPNAQIVHLGRKSIEPLVKEKGIEQFYFLNFRSLFLFCEKNYSSWKTLLIKIIVFFHLFLTLKFSLIKKLLGR